MVLNFSRFGKNQLAEFAKSENLKLTEPIQNLSFGSPSRLKKLSQDSEFLSFEEKTVEQYKNFQKMRLGERLMSITGLAELEVEDLTKSLQTWLMWQSDRLWENPEDYTKVRALGDCLQGLKRNKNKKLILQGLLLKI
jgi:hypothetical protein